MEINIDLLQRVYFTFDKAVPYKLKKGEVQIKPILLKDSELFLSCFDILCVDKNSSSDIKLIQMSYLQFICEVLLKDAKAGEEYSSKLGFILSGCLGLNNASIVIRNNCYSIVDSKENVEISSKEFDAIKKIILYQNFPKYDDSYINPDLKKAMDEEDMIRNKGIISPSLERRIAIITSHTGLSKNEQLLMTYRSHNLLFEEVVGEVEFTTIRNAALIGGGSDKLEHWIYKKRKDKFDGYITSVNDYAKNLGSNGNIKTIEADTSSYSKTINN